MQKKKHSGEELYGELGEAFNFTRGDLEANKAGFLSHRQMKRVWWNKVPSLLGFVFGALFFAAVGVPNLWGIYELVSKINQYPWPVALLVLVFAAILLFVSLFFFGIVLLCGMGVKETLKNLRSHHVARQLNNILVRKSQREPALKAYWSKPFPVSEDAYKLLKDEQIYRLFYFYVDDKLCIYSIETVSALISDEEDAVYFDEYKEKRHAEEKE